MEQKVFRRPAVAGILKEFVEARLHYDGSKKQEVVARQEKLTGGDHSAPYYLALDPSSGEILGSHKGATLASDQPFIDFLKNSLSKARERQAKLDSPSVEPK